MKPSLRAARRARREVRSLKTTGFAGIDPIHDVSAKIIRKTIFESQQQKSRCERPILMDKLNRLILSPSLRSRGLGAAIALSAFGPYPGPSPGPSTDAATASQLLGHCGPAGDISRRNPRRILLGPLLVPHPIQ